MTVKTFEAAKSSKANYPNRNSPRWGNCPRGEGDCPVAEIFSLSLIWMFRKKRLCRINNMHDGCLRLIQQN